MRGHWTENSVRESVFPAEGTACAMARHRRSRVNPRDKRVSFQAGERQGPHRLGGRGARDCDSEMTSHLRYDVML